MFDSFKEDIKSFMEHDPAARSPIEIVLLYPGFKALQSHKRAKWFLNHNMPFIARYISQRSAHNTGSSQASPPRIRPDSVLLTEPSQSRCRLRPLSDKPLPHKHRSR